MLSHACKTTGWIIDSAANRFFENEIMAPRKKTEQEIPRPLGGLNPGLLDEFLPYHSFQMHKGLSKHTEEDFSGIPLGRASFRPILLIRANPGVVQGRIAQAMSLERSSLVPVIDKLELEGYVERRPHLTDGRSKALWLTKKGERISECMEEILHARELKIFAGFSPEERNTLLALMRRATSNIWGLEVEE